MQPELAEFGVSVIALSKDTVEQAATHAARDGVAIPLLADPDCVVIRKYGVEHHKALGLTTGKLKLFGIPLSFVPSIRTMAVPTTLLIDEHGVIQWVDQTDDYRLRSSADRVLGAVRRAFGAQDGRAART